MHAIALTYKHTQSACYLGYLTQSITVNLPPLLFVIFARLYGLSLPTLGLLVTVNFVVQMLTDLAASKFVVKIGYRMCTVAALFLSLSGLILLAVLPLILPSTFAALLIAFLVFAVGSGLIEVLVSPLTDALPSDNRAAKMSLLHGFYCWGAVGVVLLTSPFLWLVGDRLWFVAPLIWSVIPLIGGIFFCLVPLPPREEDTHGSHKKLFRLPVFWLFLLLMAAGGAAEQSIAQWASLFAELGLGISKTLGDLLGPCAFAALMGLARTLYGFFGKRCNPRLMLLLSSLLTAASYLLTVFSPLPLLSLIGCALCGLGVGILWPGILSLSAERISGGGTALFAMMALGGDIGCAAGPGLVGAVSGLAAGANGFFGSGEVAGLKIGLLVALAFPVILIAGLLLLLRRPGSTPPLPVPPVASGDLPPEGIDQTDEPPPAST